MFNQHGIVLDPDEWTKRCVEQLRVQWPDSLEDELRDVAASLWREHRWGRLSPEVAAQWWVRIRPMSRL